MVEPAFVDAKETDSGTDPNGIAIVGNMNVGKSTLFSRMTDSNGSSINIPGNTISIIAGHMKGTNRLLLDTPGIFSIFSTNEDERASRDILLPHIIDSSAKEIIVVADAKNLRRSLTIALQYAEYGLPMLIDINMIDEASSRGIQIDTGRLSEILGIDVYTTIARDGMGVSKVVAGCRNIRQPKQLIAYPDSVEHFLSIAAKLLQPISISARAIGLLLLAEDRAIQQYIDSEYGSGMLERLMDLAEEYRREEPYSFILMLTNLYSKKADQIADEILTIQPLSKSPLAVKFGDWCTRLSTGIPIAAALIYIMYLFVGSFGATFLVDTINGLLFESFLIPLTTKIVEPIPVAFIRDMIVDPDFGILPTGVFLALGLVVPVLFCFYIAFGILEDSGYLPRISLLLDKLLQKMGLNGKGIIPLAMGFSCVTMAILTTRLLDTDKEKNIASFLLFLAMPCAPLIAVMLIILDKMPASATFTVFGLIFMQIIIAGYFANKIIPGERTPLFMEIPAMRVPQPVQIVRMSARRTYFFMKEALPVFIAASAFIFLFERVGGLELLEKGLGPTLSTLMGLPEKCIQVFIKTMIRRESGAAELEHLRMSYTNLQLVVNLLVMTFIIPCINSVIVLLKERGAKAGIGIIASVVVYAFLLGTIVNHVCRYLGITFT